MEETLLKSNSNTQILEINKEKIIRLHRNKVRVRAIAKQFKVNDGLIRECLVMWGETLHKRHRAKGSKNGKKYKEIPTTFFSHARQNAEERNIPYLITDSEVWKLYINQDGRCYLSGDKLDFSNSHRNGNVSLDRKDSNKDYTFDNCALTTKLTNKSKMDLSVEEYIEQSRKVSNNNDRIKQRLVSRPNRQSRVNARYIRRSDRLAGKHNAGRSRRVKKIPINGHFHSGKT